MSIMNYLQFDFETETLQQMEELIALLNEQGFEGFEEEEEYLKAFIPETRFDEAEFSLVLDRFTDIMYTQSVVEHINWNQKWEEEFKPVVIDDFVGIRAHFHRALTGVLHEIIITPKMSFGTGHHSTTHLMIQQMRSIDFAGKKILDFGTGTGVLSILADKLGAASVLAIDYDEWSITNTLENLNQNYSRNINVENLDAIPTTEKFDIILANINMNVIITNLDAIVKVSSPGAKVLLSGFLKENEKELSEALQHNGLTHLHSAQRGDWIVMVCEKR
jgi:ribosomal protein L11 methyltransferase